MKLERGQLLLYAVTDRAFAGRQTLLEQIESALRGGATMVQLREKTLPVREFLAEAVEVRALCRRYRVPLIIDDNVDVALESGADGVHVGQSDLPCPVVRAMVGPDKIVGVSAATVEEAVQAEQQGADYIGVGAMYATGTKTDARIVTPQVLDQIRQQVKLPIVVIGGINKKTIPHFKNRGIQGAAVVSAIVAQPDVEQAARELLQLWKG